MARGKRSGLNNKRQARAAIPVVAQTGRSLRDKYAEEKHLYEQYIEDMRVNKKAASNNLLASFKTLMTVLPAGSYEHKISKLDAPDCSLVNLQINITVTEKTKRLYRPASKEISFKLSFTEVKPELPGKRSTNPFGKFVDRSEEILLARPNIDNAKIKYSRNNGVMRDMPKQTGVLSLLDLPGSKELLVKAFPEIYDTQMIPKIAWARVTSNQNHIPTGAKKATNPLLRK